MSNNLKNILLGTFLVEEGSGKNFKFVIFLFLLCFVMIYSSHSVDEKIIIISDVKSEVSVLQSQFIENRKKVMKLKMESNVATIMKVRKIKSSTNPPKKIIIN
ncbi:MAG: FtsL-like putative cell division protein [Bacteroidetes bacterium]|jgi:hypothetical protein|nr:MAG: hypothetical protein ABR90_06460 [Cryomorphaceae bacterium BACL29 MAG-121220-bin8]MDA0758313.1 FtsL-like putative cell division protein [Bacteroidota bacterium]MDA1018714.1 FtsL-like putative cell division protein [Bacteroidota bacterium]|tara:strand:- start:50205 stop:50513 length:309 start_codon:yes stop_codon:yes gene_type:complete